MCSHSKKRFPGEQDPVTFDNMARAIAAFERRLMTPSRWNDFLQGDKPALSTAEKAGFLKFAEAGCQSCHMGVLVGGVMPVRSPATISSNRSSPIALHKLQGPSARER